MASPVSLVPCRPTNWSAPAALQVCPGVSPCTAGSAGAAAQAVSRHGARNRALRIDGLLLDHPAHLELAVLDREGEAALDQVHSILAELIVSPASQDIEVLPDPGGERLEIVGPRDEAGGDARLLGADLQQQLQQVADKRRIFCQAGPSRLSVRQFVMIERLGGCEGSHEAGSDVVGSPARRQSPNAPEVLLGLRRMEDDLAQRVVFYDAAAWKVLGARLGLTPRSYSLQPPENGRVAARQLEALPGVRGLESEARRVGEPLHFLVEPGSAASLLQLPHHARENCS